jgi:hypothetical protein
LAAVPDDLEKLTEDAPDDFAAFAREHGRWVQNLLLDACAGRPLVGWPFPGSPPLVVRWAAVATPEIADVLPVPSAVAVGLTRAYQQREVGGWHGLLASRVLQRLDAHVDQRLAQMWCDLALLAGERDPVAAAGLRRRVEGMARPGRWACSLEWILLMGSQLEGLDAALTVALAETHPTVRRAVSRCARSTVLTVQLRAAGLQAASEAAGPLEERLLNVVAASVDARRGDFPRPLAAPSATWLADHGLEDLVRSAARRAVALFAGSVVDLGAAEEEYLTATLLEGIVRELSAVPARTRLAGVAGPHLRVGHRTVTKKEERTSGADIGVVVDVHVPGRLRLRTGDLIQVKKSTALTPGRAGREDSWTIKRRQLHDLLEHSASAVYWLIQGTGDLLVVPAKFLAAIEGATARPSSQQFTASYAAIRHTAIPMEQYLTDLTVGLWLGSSSERTLHAAQGTGRTTRPRFALTIDILLAGQEG